MGFETRWLIHVRDSTYQALERDADDLEDWELRNCNLSLLFSCGLQDLEVKKNSMDEANEAVAFG